MSGVIVDYRLNCFPVEYAVASFSEVLTYFELRCAQVRSGISTSPRGSNSPKPSPFKGIVARRITCGYVLLHEPLVNEDNMPTNILASTTFDDVYWGVVLLMRVVASNIQVDGENVPCWRLNGDMKAAPSAAHLKRIKDFIAAEREAKSLPEYFDIASNGIYDDRATKVEAASACK